MRSDGGALWPVVVSETFVHSVRYRNMFQYHSLFRIHANCRTETGIVLVVYIQIRLNVAKRQENGDGH